MIPSYPESDNEFLQVILNKPKLLGEWVNTDVDRLKRLYYKQPSLPIEEKLKLLRRKFFLAVDAIGLPRDYVDKLGTVSKNAFYDLIRYARTPKLDTIYKIAFLLQINPQVLFLTNVDLEAFDKKIKKITMN